MSEIGLKNTVPIHVTLLIATHEPPSRVSVSDMTKGMPHIWAGPDPPSPPTPLCGLRILGLEGFSGLGHRASYAGLGFQV